ncbi:MAG: acyltransferase [Xanthomonadales bacterium]|nr:acyltransferase [Xanthomonadales bacterium]
MAVLAVVAYHAGAPGFVGGYVGVDVFFVISGFLITALLFREFEVHGDVSLRGFYERRVRRLAPALLLVIAASLLLGASFLTPIGGEQQGLAKSAIATIALVSNLYFARTTGGYFDAPTETQPLLHTWSLSVEEQFYLAWPLMLLLTARCGVRRGVGPAPAVLGVLIVTFAISLTLSIITTPTFPQFAFFGTPTRAWEFAAGALVFFLVRGRQAPIPGAGALAMLGLAGVLWSATTYSLDTPFPGYQAAVPVLATAAVLLGCEHAATSWCTRVLSVPVLVGVGLISYSLYLWHWPLLVIARLHTLGEIGSAGIAAVCATAFLLAWLSYRYVEQPVRQKQVRLMTTPMRTFAVGAAGSLLIVVLAGLLGAWAKLIWTGDPANAAMQSALAEMHKVRLACWQSRPYEGSLLARADCDQPQTGRSPSILVWGDSHASHLMPAIGAVASQAGSSARIRFMPECPPLVGYSPTLVGLQRVRGCEQFNLDVLAEVEQLRAAGLNTVVIAARWSAYVSNPRALAMAHDGLEATLSRIGALGLRALVVAPVPEFYHEVPTCLARRPPMACGISRDQADANRAVAWSLLSLATDRVESVTLIDPFPLVCSQRDCPAYDRGEVLFSDAHHLSELGSMRLRPAFSELLSRQFSRVQFALDTNPGPR